MIKALPKKLNKLMILVVMFGLITAIISPFYPSIASAETLSSVQIQSITADVGSTSEAGKPIQWTVKSEGQNLQYAWYIYKGETRIDTKWYSTSTSLKWTPTSAGSYKVRVFVKDGNGQGDQQYSSAVKVTENRLTIKQQAKLYKEPSFGAETSGSIAPQSVVVLETTSDGWYKINTSQGSRWIAPEGAKVTLDGLVYLFDQPHRKSPSGIGLKPQTVTAVDGTQSGWYKINTWAGQKWVIPGGIPYQLPNTVTLYEEATFASRDYGQLAPQTVKILDATGNGWYLINTWAGKKWIAPEGIQLKLTERIYLFDKPSLASPSGSSLSAQTVTALDGNQHGWYLVNTWLGKKWINPTGSKYQLPNVVRIYDKPGAGSKTLGALTPQDVKVVNATKDGWYLVDTWLGKKWINPNETALQVKKNLKLYSKPDLKASNFGVLAPQLVTVVDTADNGWYKVRTWLGDKWVAPEEPEAAVQPKAPAKPAEPTKLEEPEEPEAPPAADEPAPEESTAPTEPKEPEKQEETTTPEKVPAPVEPEPTEKENTEYKNYNYSFDRMVDIQMTRSPKADGAGLTLASRDLVEYYVNPLNFSKSSKDYMQFLSLSKPANLSAKEVNEKVLKGKGILAGTASAFIEAGKRYNINEVYLIAHALHETGNGKSRLATGVVVNGRTVYNMYGIAAFDDTPLESGSKYAYEQGWFTPEAAIIGGAQFVSRNYVNAGQDTLYKMRWNPDNPGVHQYATDAGWAVKQTSFISYIYDMISGYVLNFEVPRYSNQPDAEAKPGSNDSILTTAYPAGTVGYTNSGVNFRQGPSTSYSIIKALTNGTKVEVQGINSYGWYKVKVDGREGWVSGSYVDLEEIPIPAEQAAILAYPDGTAGEIRSDVNFRKGPSTDYSIITALTGGTPVKVLGINEEGWNKIIVNGETGWVYGSYLRLTNLLEIVNITSSLNVRASAPSGNVIGSLDNKELVPGVLDSSGQLVKDGNWYKIHYGSTQAWIYGGFVSEK